jgi:hypothetical protein
MPRRVVDTVIAGGPARQFTMGVGTAQRRYLGRIASEFEDHPVRRRRVDQIAVAVIGFAERSSRHFRACLRILIRHNA